MYLCGEGIDEILIELYPILLAEGAANVGTRGEMREKLGVSFRMTNPRARISRSQDRGKPFSALGELLWYLGGLNTLEFIKAYIPDYAKDAEDGILAGAYGPRIHAMRGSINQLANVTRLLKEKSTSKRAVIQLYDAADIAVHHEEIPCTTALQFVARDGRLHMSTTMRSNDAYKGLPHDVFCFTMLQEMMAARLDLHPGDYIHYATSMHVYGGSIEAMKHYLNEGHQKTVQMPPMPSGDAFSFTDALLRAEGEIRAEKKIRAADFAREPYWADIIRLLQVFWATKRQDAPGFEGLDELKAEFHDGVYRTYLERRQRTRVLRDAKTNGAA
ncbi:thymidylate synthase [Rhizobium leguminosarum]|uniref:thymidylate synthase n=1 Tax=Rhizobium leguminosarum TaxID=384 RepID=UPI001C9871A7|nr:thymidylate synthase [Rhizobium leguminosarum]MBY5754245.1 thymidylate synthase [Rhizobium leguminosarum]